MWVLEARTDAENIGYPVVWEKTKDTSNVIDYMIREEQTKDLSAEINANNQTTTGMATVIPWINAPKLINTTSIYSARYASASAAQSQIVTITSTWATWYYYRNFTLSDVYWELSYQQWWDWLIIPKTWTYVITTSYFWTSSSYKVDYFMYQWDEKIIEHLGDYSQPSSDWTYYVYLTSWKQIYRVLTFNRVTTGSSSTPRDVSFKIQSIS